MHIRSTGVGWKTQPCCFATLPARHPFCLETRNRLAEVVQTYQARQPSCHMLALQAECVGRPIQGGLWFTSQNGLGSGRDIKHVSEKPMPALFGALRPEG